MRDVLMEEVTLNVIGFNKGNVKFLLSVFCNLMNLFVQLSK